MTTEILNLTVIFNERWPRQGYMFIPTFLLAKGDILVFEWRPHDKNRYLKIEIEETDSKADQNQNHTKISTINLLNTESFEILKTGLYNIPIENPKENEFDIGKLVVYRRCNSEENFKTSPFPERYYNYNITKENSESIKKCIDWGYRTEFGSCIIKDYNDNEDLKIIFDSSLMDYHESIKTNENITKTLFVTANKGDKIVIKSIKKELDRFISVIRIEKINSVSLHGNLSNSSYFISNENSIFKIETYVYRAIYGTQDELPNDFVDLKVYRDRTSVTKDFDETYELLTVYNSVFNKNELEPIKKART